MLIGRAGSVVLTAHHDFRFRGGIDGDYVCQALSLRLQDVARKAYDEFASVQKAKGVTAQAVYQAADNPNDITVTHEFATVEAAQAFARSAELKNAMQNAGVTGTPTIWFTNRA